MRRVLFALACCSLLASVPGTAERLGYPASEFIARRKALGQALGSGTVLMFGSTMPLNGIRFRQDNDFYYVTGNTDVNAVLVMDVSNPAKPTGQRYRRWSARSSRSSAPQE